MNEKPFRPFASFSIAKKKHGIQLGGRHHRIWNALIISIGLVLSAASIAKAAERSKPPSGVFNLNPLMDRSCIQLGFLDSDSLIKEDQALEGTGLPLRIGVARDLGGIDSMWGQEEATPEGGWIWRLKIVSPGAYHLRLSIEGSRMPDGCSLFVYGNNGLADEYSGAGPFKNGEFTTWAVDGDAVTLELFWRKISSQSLSRELPFKIACLYHAYRFLGGLVEQAAHEGLCHKDVTCYAAWKDQRNASAMISFTSFRSWSVCSGTMLNDVSNDHKPFFMAAHHCISDPKAAKTIQAYFYYYTNVCNAGGADLGDSKNGAVYLAGDSAADFSLVRLTSGGFDGVFFAGWDTRVFPSGTEIACIHHPKRSYRRISFGHITRSTPNMWRINWTAGVTEVGSSGGGLFTRSRHRFIGQLYDGISSCSNQSGYDDYGKFSRAYSLGAKAFLGNAIGIDGTY